MLLLSLLIVTLPPSADPDGAVPARLARASLGSYFSTDDYPISALRRGIEGTVRFELEIAPDGHVTRCNVTGSSGDASLDTTTCAIILGRAQYLPARDAERRAIVGSDRGSVTWRLPPSSGTPFARALTITRLRWDGAGQLDCAITTNGVAKTDVGLDDCDALPGTDANNMLRRISTPIELISVVGIGPAGEGIDVVGADEAGYGVLQSDLVADLDIGQDGRITQCRIARRNVPSPALSEDLPDLCELLAPGTPPLFEATAGPAPRRAQYRFAHYIRGLPVDGETPVVTPRPSNP